MPIWVDADAWPKGSRKNNSPFSHPIFRPSCTDLHSHNPQRGLCDACGCAHSDRFNLPQTWARIPGRYSFASPKVIKEILFRATERTAVSSVTLVTNRLLYTPSSPYISAIQVADGFDVADSEIVKRLEAWDLVITADIPLAAEVISKGGHALDPRGEMYSADTIQAKLTMRAFMETLRASGVETGGPPALSNRDRQLFAKYLDHYLTNHTKQKNEKE